MKHLKIYEIYNDITSTFLKCNWCDWFGLTDDLEFGSDEDNDEVEICPECKRSGHLMDADFDTDFYEYTKHNAPKSGIIKSDYNNLEDYCKALYPEYFSVKKYNL